MQLTTAFPLLIILQPEKLFLLFNLAAEFFLCGHIGEVFRGKELVAAVQHAVVGHVLVGVGAEQKADGGIVTLRDHHFIVHPHVHVHLPHVLMAQLCGFQVDQHEAAQVVIVEHQIDIVILFLGVDALLTVGQREALAQFHEEGNQVVDDALLQVALGVGRIVLEAQKLGHHRILQVFKPVL